MINDELKIWLSDIIDYSLAVKHKKYNNTVLIFHNKKHVRKCKLEKLNNILNDNTPKIQSIIKGECLFEISLYFNTINVDYHNIWKFLEDNYSNNYSEIQDFLSNMLNDKIKNKKIYNIFIKEKIHPQLYLYKKNFKSYYNMNVSMKDIINNLDIS